MTSPGKEGAGQHVYALEPPRYLDHCIEMPSSSTPRDSAASHLKTRPIQLFVQYKPGNSGNHKDDINLCFIEDSNLASLRLTRPKKRYAGERVPPAHVVEEYYLVKRLRRSLR